MKQLHRKDLFCWSEFNCDRNIDFHSVLWMRDAGNVLIDPLRLSEHDLAHLDKLGGAAVIIITNSDHCRAAEDIASTTGAAIYGPAGEQDSFPLSCQRWIDDGEEIVSGLLAYVMQGSKTPGELALLLEDKTLITGDLIRCHQAGELCLLPDSKLADKEKALASVRRVAQITSIETVLPGDGWPIFTQGSQALELLSASI